MHWSTTGANGIIALRCSKLRGRFEDFREARSTGIRHASAGSRLTNLIDDNSVLRKLEAEDLEMLLG
jgi:hypothetical protein